MKDVMVTDQTPQGLGWLETMTRSTDDLDSIIPNGMKCKDCVNFTTHCKWLLSRKGNETECDWNPTKFIQIKKIEVCSKHNRQLDSSGGCRDCR